MAVEWKCKLEVRPQSLKRIMQYRRARNTKSNMEGILNNLRSFLEKKKIFTEYTSMRQCPRIHFGCHPISNTHLSRHSRYILCYWQLKEIYRDERGEGNNYPMLHVFEEIAIVSKPW